MKQQGHLNLSPGIKVAFMRKRSSSTCPELLLHLCCCLLTLAYTNPAIDLVVEYVQVETAGPQYNIFQTLFGASVHDANVSPPQDYTISFTCYFV